VHHIVVVEQARTGVDQDFGARLGRLLKVPLAAAPGPCRLAASTRGFPIRRSTAERPVLPRDDPACAPSAVAQAGVDPTLEDRALQDALRHAIASRRGYGSWDLDHASWNVTLHSPEESEFYGTTLEEALAWCLVWLTDQELAMRPFLP
jgi:hypothetical protein